MPVIHCPFPLCDYTTGDVDNTLAATLLQIHASGVHSTTSNAPTETPAPQLETIKRPTVAAGGTKEDLADFLIQWTEYKSVLKLTGSQVVLHLLDCCEEDLRKELTSSDSLANKTEAEVLKAIKHELRVAHLETKVRELSQLETKVIELQKELDEMKKMEKWELKREKVVLPELAKLMLHQVTPTYVVTVPKQLPMNTKAIIISVFCRFWNRDGHANLTGEIQQVGNINGGITEIENNHYNVQSNTFFYEVFVPWDTNASNQLEFKVTYCHQDVTRFGDQNYYRLEMVGYVTA